MLMHIYIFFFSFTKSYSRTFDNKEQVTRQECEVRDETFFEMLELFLLMQYYLIFWKTDFIGAAQKWAIVRTGGVEVRSICTRVEVTLKTSCSKINKLCCIL